MATIEIIENGGRYVATFWCSSLEIGDLIDLIKAAGFKWDSSKYQWWSTNSPVVGNVDPDVIRSALSLTAQLRSILATPPGTAASTAGTGTNPKGDLPVIGPGWVYVLSNEAHPDLVKIGHSTDAPENRASVLHSTGVPTPFVVEFKIYVEECGGVEAAAHNELKQFRKNPKREFFKISGHDAAKAITKIAVKHSSLSSRLIAYLRENGELRRIES